MIIIKYSIDKHVYIEQYDRKYKPGWGICCGVIIITCCPGCCARIALVVLLQLSVPRIDADFVILKNEKEIMICFSSWRKWWIQFIANTVNPFWLLLTFMQYIQID